MKKAQATIECDLCGKRFEYNNWNPWDGEHIPQPTLRIINKDVCRKCCKTLLQLTNNFYEQKQAN